ncbi:FAD-binding protein [Brucella gallinifaecis]|uniref:FAD-binding protein n=1 Tax=Brucella gallinifaecis TaxID=215590 RepID=UPI0023612220|nr:FAD-binding protein [Brucella gallinifaecis]
MADNNFVAINAQDPRYETLKRGFNLRWPEKLNDAAAEIYVCKTEREVHDALQAAIRDGKRPTVRSGGHCYEDFVSNNGSGVIIDIGLMSGFEILDDSNKHRYKLLAGSQNWNSAVELYKSENKCLPGGSCYSVGAGGHISGGGYGLLSRLHGLTVDWVAAVDILVVRDDKTVIKRHLDIGNPNPDYQNLLKACRGAGGGNFGIITAFYFNDLPLAPKKVMFGTYQIGWEQFIEKNGSTQEKDWTAKPNFLAFLKRYAQFYKESNAKRGTYGLFSMLKLTTYQSKKIALTVQYCDSNGTVANKDPLNDFLNKLKGTESAHPVEIVALDSHMGFTEIPMVTASGADAAVNLEGGLAEMDWLNATQTMNGSGPNRRGKYKSSYMKDEFIQEEADAFFKFLVRDERAQKPSFGDTRIAIDSYGGAINNKCDTNNGFDPAHNNTSIPQRKSILKLQYQTYWTSDTEDNDHVGWMRDLYYAVHAKEGLNGTPYPKSEGRYEGCYINYPDVDMKDGQIPNTSGYDWLTLYYCNMVEDLKKAKKYSDPHNIFYHNMSIPLS